MNKLNYIGHEYQLYGKQEYVLTSGLGNGCKIWHIKNGLGLEIYINLDRGFDIVSISIDGKNVSYLTPNGYVNSKYYDDKKDGFLKSFSGGFLTTCGLTQVGASNIDNNEELPLHGTYSNIPCENTCYLEDDKYLICSALILDEKIFSHKLILNRTIKISKYDCSFKVIDSIKNRGDEITPIEILYHINIGYPFLDEDVILDINSNEIESRNDYAEKDIKNYKLIHAPLSNIQEKCYYHKFLSNGEVKVYQPKFNKELIISFDHNVLPFLTEWKMLRIRDYVLGLEPGNCFPDGRNVARKKGYLEFIKPNEIKEYYFEVRFQERNK